MTSTKTPAPKTFWSYRIGEEDGLFGVYEVYFDDHGNKISGTSGRIGPSGDTIEDLKNTLHVMMYAFDHDPIKIEE